MYNSVIPSYDLDEDENNKKEKVINADDPKNKEIVHRILAG